MTAAEAGDVARLLERIPPWSNVRTGDKAGLQAVEAAVTDLEGRSLAAIVDGVAVFTALALASERAFDVAAMSKPFVAVRYLFAVPARVPIGRPGFAGFTGIPVDGDFVDDLWPWATDQNGIPRLTGYFRGYIGETYRAAEEAAYFARVYGLRALPPR